MVNGCSILPTSGDFAETKMKPSVLAVLGGFTLVAMLPAYALAAPIATIDGAYDSAAYDTPDLVFHNTSAFDFTGAQITLKGYQGLNNGIVQSVSLPNILAGTSYTYIWSGPTTAGNLTAYDYDDEYGVAPLQVGNFNVTFTAMWNSLPIFSVFSPTTNATGGFVGWEGLDPNGFAENFTYDTHNGTVNGTLANIFVGTPPGVPEPTTWGLMILGFGGMGAVLRRRRNDAVIAG